MNLLVSTGACVVASVVIFAGCKSSEARSDSAGPHAFEAFCLDRPAAAKVLSSHPELSRWLERELSERAPRYKYRLVWSNEAPRNNPSAEHGRDIDKRELIIRISPDLAPVDQVLALAYEAVSAKQLARFVALEDAVLAARVEREEFIDRLIRIEHDAHVIVSRKFMVLCPLSEVEAPIYYREMMRTPLDFDLAVERWVSNPGYRAMRARYGLMFDDIRRMATQANPGEGSIGQKEPSLAEPIAPHEPPPRASDSDAPDDRTLDSLPAPGSSGGR